MSKPVSISKIPANPSSIKSSSCEDIPKNTGTDLALLSQIKESLQRCGYRDLQSLTIQLVRGTASIHGEVPSYFLRQVAVECIKRQAGVTLIDDHIEIGNPDDECHERKCFADESNDSNVSTERRVEMQAVTRTSQDTPRSQVRQHPSLLLAYQ